VRRGEAVGTAGRDDGGGLAGLGGTGRTRRSTLVGAGRRPDCQRVLILGAAWACHLVRGASQRSSSPPRHADPTGFTTATPPLTSFEVWADVAPHYHLDPHWTEIAGYSMGGYGTFKLTGQFPDLFAKDQPTVGTSADTSLVPSLRNIPVLMWNVATDELVPPSFYLPTALALDQAGYRYELDVFAHGDHLTLAINDQDAPAAAFLGTAKVALLVACGSCVR
jgi:hypothetical protein